MCDVVHFPERNKVETTIDGTTAYVEYRIDGDTFNITHTIVPKELGGRGLARILVTVAFTMAEEEAIQKKILYIDLKNNLQRIQNLIFI